MLDFAILKRESQREKETQKSEVNDSKKFQSNTLKKKISNRNINIYVFTQEHLRQQLGTRSPRSIEEAEVQEFVKSSIQEWLYPTGFLIIT